MKTEGDIGEVEKPWRRVGFGNVGSEIGASVRERVVTGEGQR